MLITKGLINIMLKYVQSIDEKTGLVKGIGQGNNERFYMSKGMKKVDIKQSDIDNQWYLSNKCPMKSEEVKEQEKRETRIAEIKARLEELDYKTIRPLRAGETEQLAELEKQAEGLREELQELESI